ncbi:FAD-binding protein [Rhodococcus hoagii]|nr:FAD-binding protein [Prescottella equi]
MLDKARRDQGVEVVLNTRVQSLLVEDGRVAGVVADDIEVRASSVVIASGGFAQNKDLVDRLYPFANRGGDSLFVVAAEGSQGDHLAFGEQVDAGRHRRGLGSDAAHRLLPAGPTLAVGLPAQVADLRQRRRRRFMDEDASYAVSTGIIDAQQGGAWVVFDERARLNLPAGYTDWAPERILDEARPGAPSERTRSPNSRRDGRARRCSRGGRRAVERPTPERCRRRLPASSHPREQGIDADPEPIDQGPFYAARLLPAELVCTHAGVEIDGNASVRDRTGRRSRDSSRPVRPEPASSAFGTWAAATPWRTPSRWAGSPE